MGYNIYDLGDTVVSRCTFKDENGAVGDPTIVTMSFRDPSENVTTYTYGVDSELTKESAGMYVVSIDTDEAGRWFERWVGTGNSIGAAQEKFFEVRAARAVV